MDPILRPVKEAIRRWKMIPQGSLLLAAHSGGPDSTALLHILARLSGELEFALESIHFDHGLRAESAQDAEFAAQTAAELKIPFWMERDPAPPETQIQGGAREARYAFFHKIAGERRAGRVATGHTLDDSVETSIMWMLRGAGPAAFGGLPPVRDIFIRPLIYLRKRDILNWLSANKVRYVMDKSNLTDKYLRNRIRRHIIPAMEKEAPQAVAAIARLASLCGEMGRAMEEMAENAANAASRKTGPGFVTLDPSFAATAPWALRGLIYKSAARRAGAAPSSLLERHISAVDGMVNSGHLGRSVDLPGRLTVILDHGGLTFTTGGAAPAAGEIPFSFPLKALMGGGLILVEPAAARNEAGPLAAPGKVPPGAVFRGRRPGDYLLPPNLIGRKKLKKYLIEKKTPSSLRDSMPVLAVGQEALWAPGLFISPSITAGPEEPNPAVITWAPGRA